jgi:hypothetical protein
MAYSPQRFNLQNTETGSSYSYPSSLDSEERGGKDLVFGSETSTAAASLSGFTEDIVV